MEKIKDLLQKAIQVAVQLVGQYRRLIVIILAVAIIVFGVAYILGGRSVQYENTNVGFKISYPGRGWHRASADELVNINNKRAADDLKLQDAILNNKDKNALFSIITQKVASGKKFERDASIDAMDKQNIEKYPSFSKINSSKIDFLGYEGINYEIEYGVSNDKRHDLQIIFLADDTIYRLIFSAPVDKYENYKKDFEKMLENFELIKS